MNSAKFYSSTVNDGVPEESLFNTSFVPGISDLTYIKSCVYSVVPGVS